MATTSRIYPCQTPLFALYGDCIDKRNRDYNMITTKYQLENMTFFSYLCKLNSTPS